MVTLKIQPIFALLPYKVYMEFLPFPFVTPFGCRYSFGWLRTFMGKIRSRAWSLLLKKISPFQISLLVKCLQVWHFICGERDQINCKKEGSATSFEQHPWYFWDQEYRIHRSREGREWVQWRKITPRKRTNSPSESQSFVKDIYPQVVILNAKVVFPSWLSKENKLIFT